MDGAVECTQKVNLTARVERLFICVPAGLAVRLGGGLGVSSFVHAAADNDDVAPALANDHVRGRVLLAERVTCGRKANAGRTVDKVLFFRGERATRNETKDLSKERQT